MKEIKIYTKTGDSGETGLWGGNRIGKDDNRLHAYGTVDECSAIVGLARTCEIGQELDDILGTIQNLLLVVGADLATPENAATAIDRVSEEDVSLIEQWIDIFESKLPKLKQFIIQGGTPGAAYLHLARTVCRRAERWAVAVARDNAINPTLLKLLNRLSDFFFVAARYANLISGVADIQWDNPRLNKRDNSR